MTSASPDDQERQQQIKAIADECRRKLFSGVVVYDSDIIAHFPHLMPELEQALKRIRRTYTASLKGNEEARSPATGRRLSPVTPPVLRYFGDFILKDVIGRGGFGIVYLATQKSLDREVAVKAIDVTQVSDDVRQRFRQEADIIAQLDYPNIVKVYECGEDNGHLFIAMQLVKGMDLERAASTTPISVRDAARYVSQVARAIHFAHKKGIVHRDIKPANILLDQTDQPHVTDFGLAKRLDASVELTKTNVAGLGTQGYAAPEQVNGGLDEVSFKSDVYSLGATLYRLLTGDAPKLPSNSAWTPLKRPIESCVRANPLVPVDLDTICLRCLEENPGDRIPTALDLSEELERYLADLPIRSRPPTFAERVARWRRKNPLLAASVATIFVLLCSSAAWAAYSLTELARSHSEEARQTGIAKAETEAKQRANEERLNQEYVNDVVAMQQAWDRSDISRLKQLLDRHRQPAEGTHDLRGIEWYHWNAQANSAATTFKLPARASSVVWSVGGDFVYVADLEGRITRCDVATGEKKELLPTESKSFYLAVDPQGKRLAVVNARKMDEARELEFIDPASGQSMGKLTPGMMPLTAAAFSPDGKWVATSDVRGTILLYDAKSLEMRIDLTRNARSRRSIVDPRQLLDRHEDTVVDLVFSPDSHLVASSGDDGTCRLWGVPGGRSRGLITRINPGLLPSAGFNGDGTKLVTRGLPKVRDMGTRPSPGEISIWNVGSAVNLNNIVLADELTTPLESRSAVPNLRSSWRAEFVRDDHAVVAAVHNVVQMWDANSHHVIAQWKGHAAKIEAVRLSGDKEHLATVDESGELKVWNLNAPQGDRVVASLPTAVRGLISSGATGRLAAAVDHGYGTTSHGIVNPSEEKDVVLFSEDMSRQDSSINGLLLSIAASPSGRRFAVLFPLKDLRVVIGDFATGAVERELSVPDDRTSRKGTHGKGPLSDVRSIAFRGEEELYLIANDALYRWDLNGGDPVPIANVPVGDPWQTNLDVVHVPAGALMRIAFSHDGRLAATGDSSGLVTIYDVATWSQQQVFSAHTRGITGLAFSGDDQRLAVASGKYYRYSHVDGDGTPGAVGIWETRSWRQVLKLVTGAACEFPAVAFSADDRELIAAVNYLEGPDERRYRGEIVSWGPTSRPASAVSVAGTPTARPAAATETTAIRPAADPVEPKSPSPKRQASKGSLAGTELFQAGRGMVMMNGGGSGYTGLAVHPGGDLVAGVDVQAGLAIWNARTRKVINAEVLTPGGSLWRCRFSGDGQYLTCREYLQGSFHIRSTETLEDIPVPHDKLEHVLAATVDSKSKVVTSICEHQQVKLRVGNEQFTFPELDRKSAFFAEFSSNGELVAIVTRSKMAELYVISVDKRAVLFSARLGGSCKRVGFSSDSKIVYAVVANSSQEAPGNEYILESFDTDSGMPLPAVVQLDYPVAVAPDMSCLLESVSGELFARDLVTGERGKTSLAASVHDAVMFPDGKHFALADGRNAVHIHSIDQPAPDSRGLLFRARGYPHLVSSPDNRMLGCLDNTNELTVFDLASKSLRRIAFDQQLVGNPGNVFSFSNDGRRFVFTGPGRGAVAINLEDGQEVPPAQKFAEIKPPEDLSKQAPAAGRKSKSRATKAKPRPPEFVAGWWGQGDAKYLLRDGLKPADKKEFLFNGQESLSLDTENRIVRAEFGPGGSRLATTANVSITDANDKKKNDTLLEIWNADDGSRIASAQLGARHPSSLSVSSDDSSVYVLTSEMQTRSPPTLKFEFVAIESDSGREIHRRTIEHARWAVVAGNGSRIAHDLPDNQVAVIDLESGAEVKRFEVMGGKMMGTPIISQKGDALFWSANDYTVRTASLDP
jgi:serine/threonine protein kinase/WD40 repeat protein